MKFKRISTFVLAVCMFFSLAAGIPAFTAQAQDPVDLGFLHVWGDETASATASTVFGEMHDAFGARMAFANWGDSRWASGGGPTITEQWLQIEFAEPVVFDTIVVNEAFGPRVSTFDVQFLDGSGEWETIFTATGLAVNKFSFTAVTASTVRLFFHADALNDVSIFNFELYNVGRNTDDPPDDPPVNDNRLGANLVNNGDFRNGTNNWELWLSAGSGGSGNVIEDPILERPVLHVQTAVPSRDDPIGGGWSTMILHRVGALNGGALPVAEYVVEFNFLFPEGVTGDIMVGLECGGWPNEFRRQIAYEGQGWQNARVSFDLETLAATVGNPATINPGNMTLLINGWDTTEYWITDISVRGYGVRTDGIGLVTLNRSELSFGSVMEGYEPFVSQTITVTNTSGSSVSGISAELIGTNADLFVLNTSGMASSLADRSSTNFTIAPKDELPAGRYSAHVSVTVAGDAIATLLSLSFNVFSDMEGNSIFVSPDGDDENLGTPDAPLRTVIGARNQIRALKSAGDLPMGGITVYLMAGEYIFDSTVVFTAADSGSEDSPITYRAFEDDEVIFTASMTIPGNMFVPVTDESIRARFYDHVADDVLQVDLRAAGIPSSRWGRIVQASSWIRNDSATLYVDNVKQTIARWPNFDFTRIGTITMPQTAGVNATFEYDDRAPDRWGTATEPIYVSGFWMFDWRYQTMTATVDTEDRTLTLGGPSEFGVMRGRRYYAFNILEEIDMPGEWFLDRATGIMYYYPSVNNLAGSDIRFSSMEENMIFINGASHMNFIGITFENSTSGAINMDDADNIVIAGNTFRNLGWLAVQMRRTTDTVITSNNFYEFAKGAIQIENSGDIRTFTSSNNYVTNNYFTRYDLVARSYAPAVRVDKRTAGVTISNNVMHNSLHEAIEFAGVDITIENNEIYHVVHDTDDCGAIYGHYAGMITRDIHVRNNLFHDIHGFSGEDLLHGAHAVYFDFALSDNVVTSNIFYDVHSPVFGNGGQDNISSSNIFANTHYTTRIINTNGHDYWDLLLSEWNFIGANNSQWNERYPGFGELGSSPNTTRNLSTGNVVTSNLSYNVSGPNGGYRIDQPNQNIIMNNVTLTDTGHFTNAAANDYSLSSIPTGLGSDFVEPDITVMGLYYNEYRNEKFGLNDFNLVYPFDGSDDIQAYLLTLMWNPAIGATYYNVIVATDANFNNIVLEEETRNNFLVTYDLEYGETKYFWKVEAVGTSFFNPVSSDNADGIRSFTTALNAKGDTVDLVEQIQNSNDFIESALVGNRTGAYPQASFDAFVELIQEAEELLKQDVLPQSNIDAMVKRLIEGRAALELTRIPGPVSLGDLMSEDSSWHRTAGSTFNMTPNSINFTGDKFGFAGDLPNYPLWSFQMQLGDEGGQWSPNYWFGMPIRSGNILGDIWGTSGYIIIIKEDVFELQKFGVGTNPMVIIPNNGIFELGKLYDIEIGAVDTVHGVRVIFIIDGEVIYDYLDTESSVPGIGTFGFAFYGGSQLLNLTLIPVQVIDVCFDCAEEECICTEIPEPVLVNRTTSPQDFINIFETSKNSRVWILQLWVNEIYSDNTINRVRYDIPLNGNNANLDGRYTMGDGDVLVYDIKGNGSNIKDLRIVSS